MLADQCSTALGTTDMGNIRVRSGIGYCAEKILGWKPVMRGSLPG